MADARAARPSVSLADVLWELGPAAARMCPRIPERCMAPVRLACRALRDAVDGSITSLRLKLASADAQYWRPGLLHARWPRCSFVGVSVVGEEDGTPDPAAAALLALPFEGLDQSAAGATRITDVRLATEGAVLTCAESALTLVAQRLPWLQQLHAGYLHDANFSYEPEQLARMWQALAALRDLSFIELPSVRALAGAAAPLSCGCCLVTTSIPDGLTASMCAEAAAGLSHLHGLGELYLCNDTGDSAAACLAHVLDHLPASLQQLTISSLSGRGDAELKMHFKDGFIAIVEPDEDYCEDKHHSLDMAELSELAQLLLHSSALGPRLGRLDFGTVHVTNEETLEGEALASLRALVERTDRIVLGLLLTTRGCVQSLAQAIELLGKPSVLYIYNHSPGTMLRLDCAIGQSSGVAGASRTGGSSRGTAAATAGGGGELPPVPRVFEAAVRHVKAAALAAAAAAAGPAGAPGGARHMLLLTGPAVAALGGSATEEWMRSVNGGKRLDEDVLAYSLVSEAGALLMEFRSQAAAAAAAAAASEAWDDRVRKLTWPLPESKGHGTAACMLAAVIKELQAVWAPRFACAARHERLDLLRWLSRVLDRLKEIV